MKHYDPILGLPLIAIGVMWFLAAMLIPGLTFRFGFGLLSVVVLLFGVWLLIPERKG